MQADAIPVARPVRRRGTWEPVASALRAVEIFLLRGGGQRTARRNAWTAVCEDRQRAQDRREVQTFLDTPSAGSIKSGTG